MIDAFSNHFDGFSFARREVRSNKSRQHHGNQDVGQKGRVH